MTMSQTLSHALVTGADRGLGLALAARLLEKGWRVFAGQYMPAWPQLGELQARYPDRLHVVPLDVTDEDSVEAAAATIAGIGDHLDLLINSAGVLSHANEATIREAQDYPEMRRMYDVNAVGPLRVVRAFLPLTDRGTMKRLCFVSSEAGSINRGERKAWYGYCMSKAALNMEVSILFNLLRPEGYTFRVVHPGWMRTYMWGTKSTEGDMEPEEAAVPALAYFLRDLAEDQNASTRHGADRLVMRDWRGREWPW